jgi:hypothetical protein
MVRAFGSFLVLFSLLSLIVHLNAMFAVLVSGAVAVFAVEGVLAYFSRSSRAVTLRREEIL